MEQTWNKIIFTFQDGSVLTVGHMLSALLFLLVGLLLSSWISKGVGRFIIRDRMGPDSAAVVKKLVFIILVVAVVLSTLSLLNVPITQFTFLSGAVAVGLGFGAQNLINNYISGWILMSERPVRIGDFIEIDDSRGTVERIGNRSTQIRRVDGVHIMVPNSLLMERTLVNWTLVDRDIRTSVRVGVAYGSDVRLVQRLISETVIEHPDILNTPAPVIEFFDFGDNALIFDALFWCNMTAGERELRLIRSDVRYRLEELFRQHDITIAFPQRDLHIKSWPAAPPVAPADGESSS